MSIFYIYIYHSISRYLVHSPGLTVLARKARSFEPVLDDALRNDMADAYVAMRIWDFKDVCDPMGLVTGIFT